MSDHSPHDVHECVEQLRTALAAHGINLPSLGVDPLTLTSSSPPLVALGNCNTATALKLAAVLREAAPR